MVLKRGVLIMLQFILDCYPPSNPQLSFGPSRLQVLEFYNRREKVFGFMILSFITGDINEHKNV